MFVVVVVVVGLMAVVRLGIEQAALTLTVLHGQRLGKRYEKREQKSFV